MLQSPLMMSPGLRRFLLLLVTLLVTSFNVYQSLQPVFNVEAIVSEYISTHHALLAVISLPECKRKQKFKALWQFFRQTWFKSALRWSLAFPSSYCCCAFFIQQYLWQYVDTLMYFIRLQFRDIIRGACGYGSLSMHGKRRLSHSPLHYWQYCWQCCWQL